MGEKNVVRISSLPLFCFPSELLKLVEAHLGDRLDSIEQN